MIPMFAHIVSSSSIVKAIMSKHLLYTFQLTKPSALSYGLCDNQSEIDIFKVSNPQSQLRFSCSSSPHFHLPSLVRRYVTPVCQE